MIKYTLQCDQDHHFESWFQSGAAFDRLVASGMVNCTTCHSTKVSKSVMAPAISGSLAATAPKPVEKSIGALREKIEKQSDYVGANFAAEARAMHDGSKPERAIYGEAKLDDARKLINDGIPVLPLPFIPRKKTN